MSNILKGILKESNSVYGHSDPAREYGADDPVYKKRGRYPQDDTFDDDVAYSKKMYQLGQQQKAAREKAQRDSDHDRLATGTNEGVRDLGYDAQSLIMKLRRDVEEKRLQPTRQAILAAARELASDMNFAPELLVQQVLGKGVAEGLDDPWGDQGNFAGSTPVNLGGVSIKNIQTGDNVKYLGQPAKVVAMSKDRKQSRITISKGMGSVTQDVLTSDLQQLGRGTSIEEDNKTQNRMRMNDYYDLADAIQEKLKHAIQLGNKELIQKLNKERDELDARVKQYGLMPESQLDEISNEKLSQYKTAAAADAKKADSEGDYKRGDKRFSGMVKATKKQFANDTKKSGISQGINEFSPGATGPKGPKDYGQPNSSRYIGGNKFVVGTTNNYVLTATIDKWGLEWDEDDEIWFLDSPGAAHIADASEGEIELPPPREQRYQIHDLVTDYLNARNSADLQKVAAYYGHSDDGEMATNEEFRPTSGQANNIRKQTAQKMNSGNNKFVWKRPNQIGGSHTENELKALNFKYSSKHNVWGGTQDMWNSLSSNLDENLGDQLKSTSLDALVKVKLAIEKQREDEIEAWKRDFEKNTVRKAQQGLRREFEPTPVAQPGEKHSVLKARLAQLNSAIKKQALLDKLVDKLERKGLMTPAMQNDTDTRMHVRYGAKDNYQSLNAKLDNAIKMLQDRLYIRKKSGLKEGWSQKYKSSINCSHPKGFSQKAHCAGKKKHNESIDDVMEMTCPDCGMCETHGDNSKEQLDELSCWSGYHRVAGTKAGFPGSCAKNKTNEEGLSEGSEQKMSVQDTLAYLKKVMGTESHEDWRNHIINTNEYFVLKDISVNSLKSDLSGLNKTNVEKYKQMDFSKAPPIVIGSDGNILDGYHRTNVAKALKVPTLKAWVGVKKQGVAEDQHSESCPHCGGEMVSEELMNEKKDACYYKVKSRYKVWPSAYASGALVKCRNKGASNWGTGGKKNESSILEGIEQADESLHDWFNKEKWVRMDTKGKIKGPCAREPGEGKPKCLPQSKAHSLGKKGRASAAQRKRREDPNPERSGKAINVNTKKKD